MIMAAAITGSLNTSADGLFGKCHCKQSRRSLDDPAAAGAGLDDTAGGRLG